MRPPPLPPITENKYDVRAWDQTQATNDVILRKRGKQSKKFSTRQVNKLVLP